MRIERYFTFYHLMEEEMLEATVVALELEGYILLCYQ